MSERELQPGEAASGWVLAGAAIVAVVTMLYHPSAGGHGMAAVREIADETSVANHVHAIMIAALGLLLFGFAGLTDALGWKKPLPRAAFIAYAIGAAIMLGAATVNGFAIGRVARDFVATGSTDIQAIGGQISVLASLSRTWAQAAVAAQAVAYLLWALALWPRSRTLAVLGGLAALPAIAGGLGLLPLNVHGYLAVVAAQTIWTVAAGVMLARGRL